MKQVQLLKILATLVLVSHQGEVTYPIQKEVKPVKAYQLDISQITQEELDRQTKLIEMNFPDDVIPRECKIRIGFIEAYIDSDIFEYYNEQGQGSIYVHDESGLEFEIQEGKKTQQRIKGLVERYKMLKKLHQYDIENKTDYFLSDIDCYLDVNVKKYFKQSSNTPVWSFILQYKHLQQDFYYNQEESAQNRFQFFNINFIDNDPTYRFKLYADLYRQQLVFTEKLELVRLFLQPTNISPNIDLELLQLKSRNAQQIYQQKQKFNLRFNNYSGYQKINEKIYNQENFVGNYWTHPRVILGIDSFAEKEFSVYALSLTLIAIEFYKYGHNISYLKKFVNFENQINENKGYNEYVKNVKLEKRIEEGRRGTEKLREITINELCDFDDQKKQQVIQNLKNFQIATSEDFYRNNCGTCYACVLASALQMDIERLVDGEKILKGFEIVDQAHQNNGNSNNIII